MTFESITNRGEFFSNHYLDAVIAGDLTDIRRRWDDTEARHLPSTRSRLRGLPGPFFDARAAAAEATRDRRSAALNQLHDLVLTALGYTPQRGVWELKRNTEHLLEVPVAAQVETGSGLLLLALEAGLATSVDELFTFDAALVATGAVQAGELLTSFLREDHRAVRSAADAVGEVFATDDPPRFVLVLAGPIVVLAERAKWAEGRFLAVDLDAALSRNDTKAAGELDTIGALFAHDAVNPEAGPDGGGQSVLDTLVDASHKHAVGVSKDLRHGIRDSIEILANEVIAQLDAQAQARHRQLFTRSDVDARALKDQCLRYLYRLLVLLYAESRPELGILPVNDREYMAGYSLDRLRELCLVDLNDDHARTGSHIHESLQLLFDLVNDGYHAEGAQQQLLLAAAPDVLDARELRSEEDYLQFPGLDAQLFDPASTELLNRVTLRNEALQQVLRNLMLSKGKGRKGTAGFISYAQLGINQLGAVYEGLMAYSGFFADTDLYEVARHGDPSDGTWMLAVDKADEYPDDVFVTREDPVTGRPQRVLHPRGSFVFRLSGRDRQRSASYYTPEVLTRCVVRHALAELLGLDDYAPPGGSAQLTEAVEMLDLTICEPALGSGAFLNEAINQLSAEYLRRRSAELGETLDPERYNRELQKVKAHYALHQCYGVDLNATAVELAEVSLWLNAMYPGLKAPWFGLQLRQGNSLIGCRRATWRVSSLGGRPWAQTKTGSVLPPVDRPLAEPLDDDEIHHFLLPGHGWAAVADRKEAAELRPDEIKALKAWRKAVLAGPRSSDAPRLVALARGVENLWASAAERIALIQKGLRRSISVYGAPAGEPSIPVSRADALRALSDPDSALGRLRTLMDAWVGLWFWPVDSGARPPTWGEWLAVAEDLVRPDVRDGYTGQLDLFEDLAGLLAAERERSAGQLSVAQLRDAHAWLGVALDAARREGVWHWPLELAPVFRRGGFDLQVGNPPWVRPRWLEDLVLAEYDPWWGITDRPSARSVADRRAANLSDLVCAAMYLTEATSAEGVVQVLGSPQLRPVLAGVQTNLYMVFMDTVWRHLRHTGTSGLLHPEGHFTDPAGGALRRSAYQHLLREFQFPEARRWFEDIVGQRPEFAISVSGTPRPKIEFLYASAVASTRWIDESLADSGEGEIPTIQFPWGGLDLRPHKARLLTISEDILADWARLFDEPGTPAAEARLLRPVTTADLQALSVLADQPVRLADHAYHWTRGHEEDRAKTDGTIRWQTAVPPSWDEVILQGPHFTVATPFARQPNENCKHNQDYSDWNLETLPEYVIPRTNYQRLCERSEYLSRLKPWLGKPCNEYWRIAWRRMTQSGLERSSHACLIRPGSAHVDAVHTLSLPSSLDLVNLCGIMNSLPFDYLVKVSGVSKINIELLDRAPFPTADDYSRSLLLRVLRLNCLTRDYAEVWEELYESEWANDSWSDPILERVALGGIDPIWTMDTPLRRDQDRWQALVELDALAALMLGLTAEQLCAMYRTQFAVLRKYEYKMVFDAEGRKICGYHQSAGYQQSQLQEQAKAGDLPPEWKNLWLLYEQYEQDPSSVDWRGHYTAPFTRADREMAMTRAYNFFATRTTDQPSDTSGPSAETETVTPPM